MARKPSFKSSCPKFHLKKRWQQLALKNRLRSLLRRSKSLLIIVIFIIFCFAGASLMFWFETSFERDHMSSGGCAGDFTYLATVHYVYTLVTTIGYGNVYACTLPGKVFTIIFTLIGMPFALTVLSILGRLMAKGTSYLWRKLKECLKKLKQMAKRLMRCKFCRRQWAKRVRTNDVEQMSQANSEIAEERSIQVSTEIFPLSAGLSMTLAWTFLAALFFSTVEGWPLGESVYFIWISLTTVGLGDISPTSHKWLFVSYVFIFGGLSLVSMCINLLQMKIEKLIKDMQEKIRLKYQKKIEELQEAGYTDEEIKVELAKIQIQEEIDGGGTSGVWGELCPNIEQKLLSMFVSEEQQQSVVKEVKKKTHKRTVGIQYNPPPIVYVRKTSDSITPTDGKPRWRN